jgi:hypothetical protein
MHESTRLLALLYSLRATSDGELIYVLAGVSSESKSKAHAYGNAHFTVEG